jgi:hypothetical protein
LVIPLITQNIQQASKPDFMVEYAQFEVYIGINSFLPRERLELPGCLQLRLQGLVSPVLGHGYTFASNSWKDYAMERLNCWACIELYKLEPGQRPEQFTNGISHHSQVSLPRDFRVPKTWDFADDQIPVWYLEWEQTQKEGNSDQKRERRRRRGL